eukprot:jgi/Chlat1/7968/Chrsp69S00588
MDAAASVGAGVQSALGWSGSMRNFDADAVQNGSSNIVGYSNSMVEASQGGTNVEAPTVSDSFETEDTHNNDKDNKQPKQARLWTAPRQLYARRVYRSALVTTSLKPSVAYAMCQLARVDPHTHVVLDPMGGCGTIPLEAADWAHANGGFVHAVAGDKDVKAVEAYAHRLPLRDGCVDRVVSDMPFGVKSGEAKKCFQLYERVMREFARVLRPSTGRAVLLARGRISENVLATAAGDCLQLEMTLPVDMEGMRVELHVIARTASPPPPPPHRKPTSLERRRARWQAKRDRVARDETTTSADTR